MSDVLQPHPERPTPEKEAEAWLNELQERVDSVKDLPDADVLITGTVIARIGGDAVNSGFPFISKATTTDEAITPELYDRAINGFKTTWLETEGAIKRFGSFLPEKPREHFEKDLIEKYRHVFDRIVDPGFDKSEINSIFQNEGKDFLMGVHATQQTFGDEIEKAIKSPGFYRKLLF